MLKELHRIYIKCPTCHPKYLDTDQGIRCYSCDCIISGPVCAVLIRSDALRNSESNEMRFCPFCCDTATPFSIVHYFRLSCAYRMQYHATFIWQRQEYMLENVH